MQNLVSHNIKPEFSDEKPENILKLYMQSLTWKTPEHFLDL